jgi:signal-transduction protein with cAMP-binding, CBS, and nucleotidyltransferase domain
LNTWEKAKIADALETEVFDSGEVVIAQGDVGEYFYLVESGEAEVIVEGRGVVRQYKRGDYFGGTPTSLISVSKVNDRTGVVERCPSRSDRSSTIKSESRKIG